jgi:hypothetical protein
VEFTEDALQLLAREGFDAEFIARHAAEDLHRVVRALVSVRDSRAGTVAQDGPVALERRPEAASPGRGGGGGR